MNTVKVSKKLDKAKFKQVFKLIKSIEAVAYPEYMHMFQEDLSVKDLLDFCESSKVTVMYDNTMYIIVTKDEVVDLCTSSKLTIEDLIKIKSFLIDHFGTGKKFTLDARETTSYKLIQHLVRRNSICVHFDESYYWGDEVFHELTLSFL